MTTIISCYGEVKIWKMFEVNQLTTALNFVAYAGHEIAPNTVANATKITALATKIQKLVAKLATRTL